MNPSMPAPMTESVPEERAERLAWLWLVVGFAFLPFTVVQTMLPIAAWLAPIFLLRFARTARRGWVALPLIFLAQAVAMMVATRGGEATDVYSLVIGVTIFCVFRGLISTLPYAADRMIGPRLGEIARAFVFPLAFTTVDWLASLWAPLNTTGSSVYSQYDSLTLMQILSVTGMWGIAFLIGWCASMVNALWDRGFELRPVRGLLISFVAVIVAVGLFGAIRLNFAAPASPTVQAATVTVDRDVFDRSIASPLNWITFNRSNDAEHAAVRPQLQATAEQLLARTETALRSGAKIVGWQETGARILVEDRQQVLDRAAALAQRYDAYLQISLGVFTRRQTLPYYLNQSILIDNTGKIVWTYEKTYPVIPGEAYVTPHGQGSLPFADTPYGRMSGAICNDFHFVGLIRQAGRSDADIMLAPYNSVTQFEQQDSVVAIFRAIENGYSMVRATGNGASIIADYQGHILGLQNYGDGGGVMIASIPTHGEVTVYSRIGDSFAYFCAAALIGLAGWAFAGKHPELAPIH